jgi:signal transduction histidine kinase
MNPSSLMPPTNAASIQPSHLTLPPHASRKVTLVPVAPRHRSASAIELAHDLRSPMVALLVLTEALARGRFGPVSDRQLHYLRLVHEAVQGLAQVITDTVERAAPHAPDEEGGRVTPSTILDEVRRIVQPQADAAGIALAVEDAPPGAVRRHRHEILRVLLNLTSNAIKFTAAGEVSLSAHAEGPGRVTFRVQDTGPGCGFAAEEPGADALTALPRPDAHGNGVSTGLGLPMCQRLLASIGSTLEFASSPAGGSQFSFTVDL